LSPLFLRVEESSGDESETESAGENKDIEAKEEES
jgi:hypothetical protein